MPKGAFLPMQFTNRETEESRSFSLFLFIFVIGIRRFAFVNHAVFPPTHFSETVFFYPVISAGLDPVVDSSVINLVLREIKGRMRSIVRLETAIQPSVGEKSGCAR